MIYNGLFSNQQDIIKEYDLKDSEVMKLNNYTILYAYYSYESYEGESFVLLEEKETKKLFEVNGSHCSCFGLEGQWILEETTIEALMKRDSDFFNEEVKSFLLKNKLDKEIDALILKKTWREDNKI